MNLCYLNSFWVLKASAVEDLPSHRLVQDNGGHLSQNLGLGQQWGPVILLGYYDPVDTTIIPSTIVWCQLVLGQLGAESHSLTSSQDAR